MTDKLNTLRGYDDSRYLKEMADGIIVRRFASVEDAAKSVLGEETGSNIDRLRRKFREQNWYERGLNDYVEAEINRRGVAVEPPPAFDPWFVNAKGEPMGALEISVVKAILAVRAQFTPTAVFAFGGVALAWMLVAMNMRGLDIGMALAGLGAFSGIGMCLWAWTAASTATPKQAWGHLGGLVAFFSALIYGMGRLVPDPSFHMGSLPGSALLAVGLVVGSFYLVQFSMSYARKIGRDKAPEFVGLAMAIIAIGVFGGMTPLVEDFKVSINRTEVAVDAWAKMGQAIADVKSRNPDADVGPLEDLQRDIVSESVRTPEWDPNAAKTASAR